MKRHHDIWFDVPTILFSVRRMLGCDLNRPIPEIMHIFQTGMVLEYFVSRRIFLFLLKRNQNIVVLNISI